MLKIVTHSDPAVRTHRRISEQGSPTSYDDCFLFYDFFKVSGTWMTSFSLHGLHSLYIRLNQSYLSKFFIFKSTSKVKSEHLVRTGTLYIRTKFLDVLTKSFGFISTCYFVDSDLLPDVRDNNTCNIACKSCTQHNKAIRAYTKRISKMKKQTYVMMLIRATRGPEPGQYITQYYRLSESSRRKKIIQIKVRITK